MTTIVDHIKELAAGRGLTIQALEGKLGFGNGTIGRWKKSSPSVDKLDKVAEYFGVSIDYLIGKTYSGDIAPVNIRKIPLLSEYLCGGSVEIKEEYGSYSAAGAEPDCDFCIRVRGDSMINARLRDGNIAFIKQQKMVENGAVAAVAIDDKITIKRFYIRNDAVILLSDNPSCPPHIYEGEDLKRVRLLGKVVAFQSVIV